MNIILLDAVISMTLGGESKDPAAFLLMYSKTIGEEHEELRNDLLAIIEKHIAFPICADCLKACWPIHNSYIAHGRSYCCGAECYKTIDELAKGINDEY